MRHLTSEELHQGLPAIEQAPKDKGTLRKIVIRPAEDERVELQEALISFEGGVHGDGWAKQCWLTLPDGSPHPDVQIAMINTRLIDLIAQSENRWALAGDNLYVDFDVSVENLQPGDRLAVGNTVLEITAETHSGCAKFSKRFGPEALKFVNSETGKTLRLRGIYAKVVTPGTITVGDTITKITN